MLISKDRWIPHPHTFSLVDTPVIPEDMRVTDVKSNDESCNETLVRAMFGREDANAILGIPENRVGVVDIFPVALLKMENIR